MGFWAHLCAFALTLLNQGPASIFREESLDLPSPLFDKTLDLKINSHNHWDDNCPNNHYVNLFNTANKCNGPYTRKQWCGGKNIYTDYEEISNVPNTGVTNKFTLVITSGELYCGDGYCRNTTLINGTYPGPLLRGNWGDMFEITVINRLTNCNGTSIHWHGIRQFETVWEDGVPGVTECPIAPGTQKTYKWRATQYGTTWYHSHFSLQYANGIAGPLIIDGPSSMNYYEDVGPLMLTDWYHTDAFGIYYQEVLASPGPNITAPAFVVNGRGRFLVPDYFPVNDTSTTHFGCDPKADPFHCRPECASITRTTVRANRNIAPLYYKFRIINTSTQTHFTFWIEDHVFWVVATDLVPIRPIERTYLNIAIGQRYEIIVPAKTLQEIKRRRSSDYWMKMRPCSKLCVGDPCPADRPNGCKSTDFVECRSAILEYTTGDRFLPPAPGEPPFHADPEVPTSNCTDLERKTLKPMVERNLVGILPPKMKFHDPFEVDRREGSQDFTSIFGKWGDRWSTATTAGASAPTPPPVVAEDELKPRKKDDDGRHGRPFHPIPPPNYGTPEEAEKPHLWDFGSSIRDHQHPNGSYVSFMIDWANATLGLAADGVPATGWNPRFVPVILNGNDSSWKVFVVASQWNETENHDVPVNNAVPGAAHPLHVHGHDFVLLRQSHELFEYDTEYPLALDNPPRRDVVMLPAHGFVIIAFKMDNPGTWLMHCHIAWHASSGLAMQWVERPDDIPKLLPANSPQRKELTSNCEAWRSHEQTKCEWEPKEEAIQDDSGI